MRVAILARVPRRAGAVRQAPRHLLRPLCAGGVDPAPAQGAHAMPSPSILVVEHNLITLQVVRAILERVGYTVLEAQNGQSALDVMAHECPDLVLQELGLPDSDGVALVAQLQALPGAAGRPILAISELLAEPERTRLVEAGFSDYVVKP